MGADKVRVGAREEELVVTVMAPDVDGPGKAAGQRAADDPELAGGGGKSIPVLDFADWLDNDPAETPVTPGTAGKGGGMRLPVEPVVARGGSEGMGGGIGMVDASDMSVESRGGRKVEVVVVIPAVGRWLPTNAEEVGIFAM